MSNKNISHKVSRQKLFYKRNKNYRGQINSPVLIGLRNSDYTNVVIYMERKGGLKFQQITMSVIYMHYLNTASHFDHHHNDCMVIGVFEHTRVHICL